MLGTRNLVSTLSQLSHKPRVLVSASAVGYYGDQNNNTLTETCNPGSGYLSRVCVDWEQEALAAEQHGIRVVCLRIGIVLAPEGGALTRMLTPFKLGFGGRLGHGNQWMPWIHIDDVIGMAQHAANCDELRGPVNVVAPEPVTNAVFTQELGSALNRPAILPVPEAALKLAFGDMVEILMSSHRAIPVKAEQSGYKFQYRQLSLALRQLLNSNDI